MPTYACWTEKGSVSPENREAISRTLMELHHEVAVAPRYFVQVLFPEVEAGSMFIAGEPAPRGQMWIRADIRAGRTPEQKRELLERITVDVGRILGTSPENIWVYLCDVPGANIAEYGRVLPDPGEEDAWFAALPEDLRSRLSQRL